MIFFSSSFSCFSFSSSSIISFAPSFLLCRCSSLSAVGSCSVYGCFKYELLVRRLRFGLPNSIATFGFIFEALLASDTIEEEPFDATSSASSPSLKLVRSSRRSMSSTEYSSER